MSVDAPAFEDVLDAATRASISGLNFCTVGVVQAYDGQKRRATVQPSIIRTSVAGDLITPSPIANVPVAMPSTILAGLQFDVPLGTLGMLIFADAGIGDWLAKPTAPPIVEPTSKATHAAHDAIFYPGVVPFAMARGTEANMLELYNGVGRLKIDTLGRMKLGTELVDLLGLFDQLVDALMAGVTTVPALATPQPTFIPATIVLLSKIKSQLATIKQ